MEMPMLAIVNTVLRRLRQQFFRTSGRYRTNFRITAVRRAIPALIGERRIGTGKCNGACRKQPLPDEVRKI
jgi:hypothetical protein